jgi:hypothetical protein
VFFENYPSPDQLLHSAMGSFRRNERELRGHWDRLQERWARIKEVAQSTPADLAAPPEKLEKAWRTARHLVETLAGDF